MSSGLTALIVDDAEIMRTVVSTAFSHLDIEVVGEAVDGRSAVEMAADLSPDIITLDIYMPELNGLLALREIIAHNRRAYVVMMTSIDDKEVIEECLNSGARDYIEKTLPVPEIVQKLAAHKQYVIQRRQDGIQASV